MAINENGQLYFTFEEIEEKLERFAMFTKYLNEKSSMNEDEVIGIKSLHRWNRILKLKGYVWESTSELVKQATLKRVSFQ